MTDCGCVTAETAGAATLVTLRSSGAAGSVGRSVMDEPVMSGHQHGAFDPAPWSIDDGIVS